MNALMFAQVLAGYSLAHLAVVVIVVAAIVAIVLAVLKSHGIVIPPLVITVAWIILAAVLGVFAIRLLLSLV